MITWETLLTGAICAAGALAFLRLVADDIARTEHMLDRYDRRERKLAKQRREEGVTQAATDDEGVVTLEAA